MRMMSSLSRLEFALRGLVVAALFAFGSTCARGGLDCTADRSVQEHAVASVGHDHDADGHCADADGCDRHPTTPCSHASICCSTWGPPPATVTVEVPAAATVVPMAEVAVLVSGTDLAPGLVPIPSESPPLVASFLRI